MKIDNNNYFSVQAWMVNELNLRGVERDVFAIIYGYSQDKESDFHGSLEYLSQLTGYSRNSICTALKSLTDKQFIIKEEKTINNIKYCRYRTSSLDGIQAPWTGNSENKEKGVQAPWTNNKVIKQNNDNKENNKDYCQKKTFEFGKVRTDNNFNVDKFMQWYNEYCKELSVIRKLTDKRKKAISQLFKNYSEDDIKQVLINVSNSNFLLGKVTDFKAGLDWILNENNFIKILEGRYNSKPKTSKQISSDMGRHNEVMTAAQKKQFKEDVASGRAEKF